MDPFESERLNMVKSQIEGRGVTNARVLDVMRRVPRHVFVPEKYRAQAYNDHPALIGEGQTISQPYMVALMTELLDLHPRARVLEIGTGSGYQAAVLAELAGSVVTIERHEVLASQARDRLRDLGYANITVIVGDGTVGYEEEAPYDGILVTAGAPDVPPSLKFQLAVGGRLVCPAGGRGVQTLMTIMRRSSDFHVEAGIDCMFVPLIGEEGWPEV